MAIKQAIRSTVLGDGEGIGDEGPTRWIVVPPGVDEKLDGFSSSSGLFAKIGCLNVIGSLAGCLPGPLVALFGR